MKTLRHGRGSFGSRPDWRTYQSGLKRTKDYRRKSNKVYTRIAAAVVLGGLIYGFCGVLPINIGTLKDRWITPLFTTTAQVPVPEGEASAEKATVSDPGAAARNRVPALEDASPSSITATIAAAHHPFRSPGKRRRSIRIGSGSPRFEARGG